MNNNTLRGLTADQRKEFIRRASFISEADRDTRVAFVDEIVRAALASAPVADNWQQYALSGETTAEQVCKRMDEEVTRRTVDAMRRSDDARETSDEIERLRAALASAPVAKRQYHYRMPNCTPGRPECRNGNGYPECPCWHDVGTGPLAGKEATATDWRDKPSAPVADGEWPTLSDLHLQALMFAYNEGYSKAIDGRKFKNPFETSGSQAAAWELGTQDGTKARSKMASAPVADQWQAVAYLDLGAGGYMDVGTDLTDEQLAALPKGRHMLTIIGTHGVNGYTPASAPVAGEAQKPVAVVADNFALHWVGTGPIGPIVKRHGLKVGSRLYAEPQVQGKLVAVLNVVENGYGRTVDVEMLEAGNQLPTGRWAVRLAMPSE